MTDEKVFFFSLLLISVEILKKVKVNVPLTDHLIAAAATEKGKTVARKRKHKSKKLAWVWERN